MTTLEEIYQKYFGCDVPFNKHGRLTKSGAEAQKKLLSLLQDLETIKVIGDARLSIVEIDEISGAGISYRQEMCNDLMRFVTSGTEEYELEDPVIVESPSGETFKVKFLSRDTDYKDIFMTEEPWKTTEDNSIDIYDFTCLSEEDAEKVFHAVLCQEIENGWEWMEHARTLLRKEVPETEYDEMIDAFVCENWQNMKTDAWNIENFLNEL